MKKTFIYGCDWCGEKYELKQKSQAGAKAGKQINYKLIFKKNYGKKIIH